MGGIIGAHPCLYDRLVASKKLFKIIIDTHRGTLKVMVLRVRAISGVFIGWSIV